MAAPPFVIRQNLVSCKDSNPGVPGMTGALTIHSSCCFKVGKTMKLSNRSHLDNGRNLKWTSGTTFQSDAFRLCTRTAGKCWTFLFPDDPSPIEGMPWIGGNMDVQINGACSGQQFAATIDISSEASLASGAAAWKASIDALGCWPSSAVTVTANWNGGVARTIRVCFPNDGTAPTSLTFGDEFIVYTGDANEAASPPATITASTAGPVAVNAYQTLTWTHCGLQGIVAEIRNLVGDVVLSRHTNLYYPVKMGLRTILNLTFYTCDHPCEGLLSPSQIDPATNGQRILCFTANTNPF